MMTNYFGTMMVVATIAICIAALALLKHWFSTRKKKAEAEERAKAKIDRDALIGVALLAGLVGLGMFVKGNEPENVEQVNDITE